MFSSVFGDSIVVYRLIIVLKANVNRRFPKHYLTTYQLGTKKAASFDAAFSEQYKKEITLLLVLLQQVQLLFSLLF